MLSHSNGTLLSLSLGSQMRKIGSLRAIRSAHGTLSGMDLKTLWWCARGMLLAAYQCVKHSRRQGA
jgi:hypothetical protein